ncbi:MAG: SpoIIE family protein phosphatase [Eubacteriales bacterium]
MFLEKMLACGNDKTTTLEMLNMFLKNRGAECFATIDLLEIDMHTGTASFIKSGAAPSYIVRGGNLFRIASGTLPVGILSDISAEVTEFGLEKGDVIVMVSDGICGDPELDSTWLCDYLTKEMTDDLALTAEKIMLRAKKENKRSDDMTVELLRIEAPAKNAMDKVPSVTGEFSPFGDDFSVQIGG